MTELPYCNWFVRVSGCADAETHRAVRVACLAVAAAASVLALLYFVVRRAKGHRLLFSFGPGAIDGTFLLVTLACIMRFVDSAVVVADAFPSYVAAWIVTEISSLLILSAIVYFVFSIFFSFTTVRLGGKSDTQLIPKPVVIAFCAVEVLGGTVVVITIATLLGQEQDRGVPDVDSRMLLARNAVWAILVGLLAIAFIVCSSKLLAMLRSYNAAGASRVQSAATARAVARIKLFVFVVGPVLTLYTLVLVVYTAAREPIMSHRPASIIFYLWFFMATDVVVVVCTPVLILMEVSGWGFMDDSEKGSTSGNGSARGRGVFFLGRVRFGGGSGGGSGAPVESTAPAPAAEPSKVLQDALASLTDADEHHRPLSLAVIDL